MITVASVLAVILSLPQFYLDVPKFGAAEREALVRPVAEAIVEVARSRTEAAAMVALAYHESRFSDSVLRGACDELPKGMRCDEHKGVPLARGAWQLHESACRTAWAFPAGSVESLRAEARCVIRLLRWNAKRGKGVAPSDLRGAFAGYAARDWNWPGAETRERTVELLLKKWPRTPPTSAAEPTKRQP